jgi:hypothetical protein
VGKSIGEISGKGFFAVKKRYKLAGHWWLTPVILASWEAEIRRIAVQG